MTDFSLNQHVGMLLFKKVMVWRKRCHAKLGFSLCLERLLFENRVVEKSLFCTTFLLYRLLCLIGNSLVEKRRLEEEAGHPHRETKALKRREQARRTRGVKGRYDK